ncbi:MAG TPA: hypothetical protein VIM02_02640 [Rhizomicrobium sp.]|jgi:hypothetical protein
MSEDDLVVIPLPTLDNRITYATARLIEENGRPFAEAIVAIPNTIFAPPRKISLSPHSLVRLRAGSPGRPSLYLYEGMILPPP